MKSGLTIVVVLAIAVAAFLAGAQSQKGELLAADERASECNRLLDEAHAARSESALAEIGDVNAVLRPREGDPYCARCEVVSVRPDETDSQ